MIPERSSAEESGSRLYEFLVTLSFRGDSFDGWNLGSQTRTSHHKSEVKPLRVALKDVLTTALTSLSDLRIIPLANIARGMHCRSLGVKVSFRSTLSVDATLVKQFVAEKIKPNGQVLQVEPYEFDRFDSFEVVEAYTTCIYSASRYCPLLAPFAIYCPSELCDSVIGTINQSLLENKRSMALEGQHILQASARLCTASSLDWGVNRGFGDLSTVRLVEVLVRGYGIGFRESARRLLWAITRDVAKANYDLSSLNVLRSKMPLLQLRYLTLRETTFSEVKRVTMDRKSKPAVYLQSRHETPQSPCSTPGTNTVRKDKEEKLSLDGHFVGNFKNYYKFNPTTLRMQKLDCDVFREVLSSQRVGSLLDLGCNQGDLTIALHKLLQKENGALETVGVDVDAELIETAKALHNVPCKFMKCDLLSSTDRQEVLGERTFDVVACFGLTMWIHLNHGDDGLVLFLKTLKELTRSMLVIEPQNWKSYRSAKARIRRAGGTIPKSFTSLQVTGEAVQELIDTTLKSGNLRHDLGKTEWQRQVFVYTK